MIELKIYTFIMIKKAREILKMQKQIKINSNISLDLDKISGFCVKWKIRELSLFGSILRDDFGPESDVDVLVSFEDDAPWSYFEWADMTDELKEIFGHNVDLVEKDSLKNPYRRHAILRTREVVYEAG
jgi:predicted nucleotidyltransferase